MLYWIGKEDRTQFFSQNPNWVYMYRKDIIFTPTCEFILTVYLTLRHWSYWICYWMSSQHRKVTNAVCVVKTSVLEIWGCFYLSSSRKPQCSQCWKHATAVHSLCTIQRWNITSASLLCPKIFCPGNSCCSDSSVSQNTRVIRLWCPGFFLSVCHRIFLLEICGKKRLLAQFK